MNLKEFYEKLNNILESYSDGDIEKNIASNRLEDLIVEAENNDLNINMNTSIIDDVQVNASYGDDYYDSSSY